MKNMENSNALICPHSEFCGGCVHQGIPYEKQLEIKENEVLKLIEDRNITVDRIDRIEGCADCYSYRNKMEYTFGDMVKNGPLTLGMHKKRSFMSVVTVDSCQIVHEDFNIILDAVISFCNEKGYEKYNKKTHTGMMRNLVLRRGIRTKELLINIVTVSDSYSGINFDEEAFVNMISGLLLNNTVVGILRTECNSLADAVIPEKVKVLSGRDYYNEKILDLGFKVSAFSFFQTNVEAAERLYTQALNLFTSFENKNVFDLYCGTGTISQILALKANHVLGVEIVEEAVEAAKENANRNGLDNCEFYAGDVFEVLEGKIAEKPDVIVVDPPRAGMTPKALDKIISYGVDEIVYISCNPKTLVENLYYLDYYGYKCRYLKPFDNFPFTKHTECIALLSKIH